MLNHWLHKLDESGTRERLWTKWTYKATEDFGVEDAIELGFNEITFVFLWILGGIVLALVFFLVEKCAFKVMPRKAGNDSKAWNEKKIGADLFVA